MADDMPEAEAVTASLKLTRPPSPKKTNSNDHTLEDGGMAHMGSVKRVRSFDAEDQETTTNSSSPKRVRLNDDDDKAITNCKEPNVNNKDHNKASNDDKNGTKDDHINSNGAVDDAKDASPNDSTKEKSEDSIGGPSDADKSSQDKPDKNKENNSQNSTAMETDGSNKSPQNGAPLEPSKEAEENSAQESQTKDAPASETKDAPASETKDALASETKDAPASETKDAPSSETKDAPASEIKDAPASESSVKSTLTESNSSDDKERTDSSEGTSGDKVCDSNAKENDKNVSKDDPDEDAEEKMEVDAKEEDKEEKPINGDDAKNKESGDTAKGDSDSSKDDVASKDDVTKEGGAKVEDSQKSEENKEWNKEVVKDDIIELSDDKDKDEDDKSSNSSSRPLTPIPEPTDPLDHLTEEQLKARDNIIKSLNEELRNEEAKLLLLKKLRQSQLQPVVTEPKEDAIAVDAVAAKIVGHTANAVPPPLVHGPGTLKPQLANQLGQQQRLQMPQLIRGNMQQAQGLHGNIQSGPPPLVLARGSLNNLSTLHAQQQQMNRNQMMRMMTSGHLTQTTNTQSLAQQHRVSNSVNETQSAASRQAAAKLALRKQLEKTLLQIPPPKPPPPELHFLPSAANNEFIILVGLEEVVNVILEYEKKDNKGKKDSKYLAPYKCAQCKTDFTTIWKQGSKAGIMCENCIVSNQKKALKAEHTNRLKTAFVKALQQEQEIEQRMQQSHSAAASAASSLNIPKVKSVRQVPLAHSSHQSLQGHHGIQVIQQPRQRVLNPAPQQRTMQPVTYAYIPQAAGINIAGVSRGIQMIPKQQFIGGVPGMVTASDRQREYLLDMISSKSNSGSTVNWRR